jgi:hypothetical protein
MQAFQPGKWRILTAPAPLKTASRTIVTSDRLFFVPAAVRPGLAMPNKLLFNTATLAIMLKPINTSTIHDSARE